MDIIYSCTCNYGSRDDPTGRDADGRVRRPSPALWRTGSDSRSCRIACSVLFASDRGVAVDLFGSAARRHGCTFHHRRSPRHDNASRVHSARLGAGRRSRRSNEHLIEDVAAPPPDGWPHPEHGDATDVGALEDLLLLARGDVLIGTFLSSFTLAAQELMAARPRALSDPMPLAIYCGVGEVSPGELHGRALPTSRCSRPRPLLASHWHASFAARLSEQPVGAAQF